MKTHRYEIEVPPSTEMGIYLVSVFPPLKESLAKTALLHYNLNRASSGLGPVSRMPNCTSYKKITK